jgi:pimeloyl-ACP methyl ester carboxylesterase
MSVASPTLDAMSSSPIILVPGFWLGAWAWDAVAGDLRARGLDVTALTLPGLQPDSDERASVSLADHVDAIVAAIEASSAPVVLAVHSGAGAPGYAVTDRVPGRIAAMVYVDTGPAKGALDPDFSDEVKPLPASWEDLGENLDGISENQLAEFRARAVPEPGGPIRDAHDFVDDARLGIPTTVVCTAFTSTQYQEAAAEGYPFLAGLAELTDVSYVDLPTSHWPMWSRPQELAEIISSVATTD